MTIWGKLLLIIIVELIISDYKILSVQNDIKKRIVRSNMNRSFVSNTKSNWVYQPSPRVGTLYMKLEDGRVMYPGLLNCNRNKVKISEFNQNVFISFPSAKSDHLYTIVIYKDNYLERAVTNIKGEDLYEGNINGYVVAELTNVENSNLNEIHFVEILEQGKDKEVPTDTYDPHEWNTIHAKWRDEIMNDSASKTCITIVPDGQVENQTEINDITLLINQFFT